MKNIRGELFVTVTFSNIDTPPPASTPGFVNVIMTDATGSVSAASYHPLKTVSQDLRIEQKQCSPDVGGGVRCGAEMLLISISI